MTQSMLFRTRPLLWPHETRSAFPIHLWPCHFLLKSLWRSFSASTPLRNWAGLIFGAGRPLHWQAFTSTPALPWGPSSKESARNAGDTGDKGSIPGSGRSAAGGYGNPFRYSCLENPMGRGAWRATVHGVAKSRTWLKRLSRNTHIGRGCLWSSLTYFGSCDQFKASHCGPFWDLVLRDRGGYLMTHIRGSASLSPVK